MTLEDLGTALRRFWPLAAGIFVAVVAIGLLAALIPATKYRSTETMLVQPTTEDLLAVSAAAEFLTPPVLERVGSDQFERDVRAQLPSSDQDVDLSLSAENEAGTGIVFVRADSTDPDMAVAAAKRAGALLIDDPISSAISISVLNPATDAHSIASTRRAILIVGSIMLGLILAVLAAVAAHSMRPRSSNAQSVSDRFGLPVLGEIPASRNLPATTEAVFNGTGSIEVMEASEKLAVNVDLLVGEGAKLAVTSWASGEGKTVATAQLAWGLARLGHDVTAIDCDLRKPALHRALGINPSFGVVNLADDASIRSVRQATGLDSLEAIAAGDAEGRHPAEIIGPAMERIATDLGSRTVLIDTPPLFGAETSIIAARVDAVILVVDSRSTHPAELRGAIRDLELSNAKILGVVLNRTRQAARRRGTQRYYAQSARSQARSQAQAKTRSRAKTETKT